MRIFFFSDWRLPRLSLLEAMIEKAEPIDIIIYGGDDTSRFVPEPKISEGMLWKIASVCGFTNEDLMINNWIYSQKHQDIPSLKTQLEEVEWHKEDPKILIDAVARILRRKPEVVPSPVENRRRLP